MSESVAPQLKEIDFRIFDSTSIDCTLLNGRLIDGKEMIAQCSSLRRTAVALKYNELLCGNEEILRQFHNEIYSSFLNDYIHIIKYHCADPKGIATELKEEYALKRCNISECKKLQRYYRQNGADDDDQDEGDEYYRNYYDQIHHLFFHLYDLGLRIDLNENKLDDMDDDENEDNDVLCIDKVFSRQLNMIRQKRKEYRNDNERYNAPNNKYNIKIVMDGDNMDNTDYTTFFDALYDGLKHEKEIKDVFSAINALEKYFNEYEYDTESVKHDLDETLGDASNIAQFIQNAEIIKFIKDYIQYIKVTSASFSTGFGFSYWDIEDGLYISPFYSSLKEEILSSGFINIKQWNDIVFKAEHYLQTEKGKNIKYREPYPEHGYTEGDSISLSHFVCIVLYCDWSHLCTEFSASFRKRNVYESVDSVKNRNAKYAHFSKSLLETVSHFGICGDEYEEDHEYGPFYCGMCRVMNMPSFAINFLSPCSTTKQFEVSMNFATRDGIILQLQNDGESEFQRFFDCSWISKYPDEDERLFFTVNAVVYQLRLQSIRIVDTAQNFEPFLGAFYLFDAMLSGNRIGNIRVTSSDIKILNALIDNKLNGASHKVDPYITDTFDLFCQKKEEITITIRYFDEYFQKLNHLIIDSVFNFGTKYDEKRDELIKGNNNKQHDISCNVLKQEIFTLFPNVKRIWIYTTTALIPATKGEYPIYKFGLSSFLTFIEHIDTSIQYQVWAERKKDNMGYFGDTWLKDIDTSVLINAGWNVTKEKHLNSFNKQYTCDILTIGK